MTKDKGKALDVAQGDAVEQPHLPVDEVRQGASDEGRPLVPTIDPPEPEDDE